MANLNVYFFGSWSFVIPILSSIKNLSSEDLGTIAKNQLTWLFESGYINQGFKNRVEELLLNNPEIATTKIELISVISQPDRELRGKIFSNEVVKFCRENGINTFLPEKINQQAKELKTMLRNQNSVGIVAAFGQIISPEIIDSFTSGLINWHPSKLPLYRGPTPIQSALLAGESSTGLSWIEVVKQMDAGKIILQFDEKIDSLWTAKELSEKMALIGENSWAISILINQLKNKIKDDELKLKEQQHHKATFTKMLTKKDKYFNPRDLTGHEVYNKFRAFFLYPGVAFFDEDYFKFEVNIAKCLPASKITGKLVFDSKYWQQTSENGFLRTYLKCNKSKIEVLKIKNSNGKTINFSGYLFK